MSGELTQPTLDKDDVADVNQDADVDQDADRVGIDGVEGVNEVEGNSSYLNFKMVALYIVVFFVVTGIVLLIIRFGGGYSLTDNCNPENKFDIQKNCVSKFSYFSIIYGISIAFGLGGVFLTYIILTYF